GTGAAGQVVADGGARGGARAGVGEGDREADRVTQIDRAVVGGLRQGQARAVDVLRGGGRAAAVVGRREVGGVVVGAAVGEGRVRRHVDDDAGAARQGDRAAGQGLDRKSTRLNSSHVETSYAVVCLKKKTGPTRQ